MYVIPMFLMQSAKHMPVLHKLVLHDHLPDTPPQKVKCSTCSAWETTYDLSPIIFTAASCLPSLRCFDFTTHYISDAECSATAHMTQLTSLTFRSTHGIKPGGLGALAPLRNLRALSILDNQRAANVQDITALKSMTQLTSLRLGFARAFVSTTIDGLTEANADGGFPPVISNLRHLSLICAWDLESREGGLSGACQFTHLTRLELDFMNTNPSAEAMTRAAALQGLTKLTGLQELAVTWPVDLAFLSMLAPLTQLTLLQVGGLPALRQPPALRLPSIHAVKSRLRVPVANALNLEAMDNHPVLQLLGLDERDMPALWCGILACFPSLTSLDLEGGIHGEALCCIPQVGPRC
eukprot:jgi/Chrzof1/5849/Cz16g18020.t1